MLWTIFVILLVLWLPGVVSSYTFGGFIHILLIIALAVILINFISGRRALWTQAMRDPERRVIPRFLALAIILRL